MTKMHEVVVDGQVFYIKKSNRQYKKYDVFDANHQYILSFGDSRYQHFYDQMGDYNYLNHLDAFRRHSYRKRSSRIGNLTNPYSANFWSYNFLW